MDDLQIAKTLKDIQLEMLTHQEVVHFLTKMNHLELRVKNVATTMLIKQTNLNVKRDVRSALAKVINDAIQKNSKTQNLQRLNTFTPPANDGLVDRLTEKVTETMTKIDAQNHTLAKLRKNVELLMPHNSRPYNVIADSSIASSMDFDNKKRA